LPKGVPAVEPGAIGPVFSFLVIQIVQGSNGSQRLQFVFAQGGNAAGEIVDGCEGGLGAFGDESAAGFFAETANVAKADAKSKVFFTAETRRHGGAI
jgi:hypothetical protein